MKKAKMLKAIWFDTVNKKISVVEIEDKLDDIYRLTNCDCVEFVRRPIDGNFYTIICDDCGALKEETHLAAFSKTTSEVIWGNILICNEKGENLASLSNKDIKLIYQRIVNVGNPDCPLILFD